MSTRLRLRVGTRGSPLARRQTEEALARLRDVLGTAVAFEVRVLSTRGDEDLRRALPEFGDRGVFVKEVEAALLEGEIDLAVHSLKDLPVEDSPGLQVACVPVRRTPLDALAGGQPGAGPDPLQALPAGARVGTGSPRRAAQLRHRRADLRFVPIRGNVETRLGRIGREVDAVVLAAAGLERLGLAHRAEVLPARVCLPAPGQGALALQVRAADRELLTGLRRVEDVRARLEVEAERALLQELGGGCHAAVGALARWRGEHLELEGVIAGGEGIFRARGEVLLTPPPLTTAEACQAARGLGRLVAQALRRKPG